MTTMATMASPVKKNKLSKEEEDEVMKELVCIPEFSNLSSSEPVATGREVLSSMQTMCNDPHSIEDMVPIQFSPN
jgi:hypothetical protein